jgi:hypothetical protein
MLLSPNSLLLVSLAEQNWQPSLFKAKLFLHRHSLNFNWKSHDHMRWSKVDTIRRHFRTSEVRTRRDVGGRLYIRSRLCIAIDSGEILALTRQDNPDLA